MVTVNLEAALRQLRLPDETLTLWIDAICIDQKNNVEKGEQLEQMRQVYSQARAVVTWLGPAADNSDFALQWIHKYGGRAFELGIGDRPELRLRYLLESLETTRKDLLNENLRVFAEDLRDQLSTKNVEYTDLINSLLHLFNRPYWSRIWVVQELASASTVTFICGNKTTTDHAVNHALRLLRNFGQYQHLRWNHDCPITNNNHAVNTNAIHTHKPISLLKFRNGARPSSLIYLMRHFRYFQATDPRDKIFALLGIATDNETLGLHPDYRKTSDEVYIDLARTFIQHGHIEILSLCEFPKKVPGLPSWVHDWSLMSYRATLQQRALVRSAKSVSTILEPRFSASGTSKAMIVHGGPAVDRKMPVQLRATFLGEVRQIGMHWENDGVGRWLLDLQRLSNLIPYTSELPCEKAHAVWRTAVADQEVRQGIRKPRLSEEKVHVIHEILDKMDMSLISTQTVTGKGLSDYCDQLRAVAQDRRPLLVAGNYIGIGPRETKEGDLVFILLGADTPYILRRHSQDETLHLIGEAYVHGVMDGEIMKGDPAIETIVLS